jgi:hypothetical protein
MYTEKESWWLQSQHYHACHVVKLESIFAKISRYEADLPYSVVSFISGSSWFISRWHNCENYGCWLIGHHRCIWMYVWRTLLLSCNTFQTNSDSNEYNNKSANKGPYLVPIGMPTECLKTWSPKNLINIVFKKAKHTLNVCFRVLIWGIRMVPHRVCILFPNYKNFVFPGVIFVLKNNYLWSAKNDLLICCEKLLYKVWRHHMFWCCQF